MKGEDAIITQKREVYDALLHTLGREHAGTVKAKYALARAILDHGSESSEAMLLMAELTDDIVKNGIELDEDFDGLVYYYTAALFDNVEDDDTLVSMLESLINEIPWSDVVQNPNEQALQYCDMCDMLIQVYMEQRQLDMAMSVAQQCLETLCRTFPFYFPCVEDIVETIGAIHAARGRRKDVKEHGELIDFIVSRNNERIATLSRMLDEESKKDEPDLSIVMDTYHDLYDTLESNVSYLVSAMTGQKALVTKKRRKALLSFIEMMKRIVESSIEIAGRLSSRQQEEVDDERFFEVFEKTLDGQAEDGQEDLDSLLEGLKALGKCIEEAQDDDMSGALEAFRLIAHSYHI